MLNASDHYYSMSCSVGKLSVVDEDTLQISGQKNVSIDVMVM